MTNQQQDINAEIDKIMARLDHFTERFDRHQQATHFRRKFIVVLVVFALVSLGASILMGESITSIISGVAVEIVGTAFAFIMIDNFYRSNYRAEDVMDFENEAGDINEFLELADKLDKVTDVLLADVMQKVNADKQSQSTVNDFGIDNRRN